MKKVAIVCTCILLLLLSGCDNSYERDDRAGKVETITVAQMQKKIEQKESFAIVFTQNSCAHCVAFKEMLDVYLLDHHVVLYDVILDEAPSTEWKSNLKTIRKTFEGMDETPSLFYVKDGKKADERIGELDQDTFDDFVQAHRLDEKK